jgi:hypothetical protein
MAEPKTLAAQIMVASQGAAPKVAEAIVYLKPIAKPVRCRSRCHPLQSVGSHPSAARWLTHPSAARWLTPPPAARWLTHPSATPQIGFIATMIIDCCGPLYIKLFQLGYRAYHELPTDLLSALIGLGLSFCGGAYCASISAIEAVRMSGWDRTQSALEEIYTDACAMYKAYVADDDSSANADDLLTRKLAVVAVAVKDPEQLSAALGGLYTSWLAVQAVLRIEFAKTITLGVSIAAMATPYLQKVGYRSGALTLTLTRTLRLRPSQRLRPRPDLNPAPTPAPAPELRLRLHQVGLRVLVHVMPPAYHHWIPMVIANTARSIGVAVAWKMQAQRTARGPSTKAHPALCDLCTLCALCTISTLRASAPSAQLYAPTRRLRTARTARTVQEVVSAMHLALLGGLLFSRSILRWARRQGYALPAAEDTVLDEVAGYAVAALGFYYQYAWGFALPFPLSLLFFPLGCIEWYIRWAVTSTAAIA